MYEITSKHGVTEILLYDEVGLWGVTAKQFRGDLRNIKTDEINLRINSPGGDVFDGFAMFESLKSHPAHVVVDVDSEASSIASVIAMAGDTIRMSSYSDMMIHNARGGTWGEPKDQAVFLDILTKKNEDIIDVYQSRTDLPRDEIAEMMAATTWMSAEDAVAHGFADEISDRVDLVVEALWRDPQRFPNPPERVRNRMAKQPVASSEGEPWQRTIARERLRLTKLRR